MPPLLPSSPLSLHMLVPFAPPASFASTSMLYTHTHNFMCMESRSTSKRKHDICFSQTGVIPSVQFSPIKFPSSCFPFPFVPAAFDWVIVLCQDMKKLSLN